MLWPERALIRELGWVDAFRAINGYGTRDASWTFKGGWRLDHVLVDGLEVRAAAYSHEISAVSGTWSSSERLAFDAGGGVG